ncbi:hypothetical protein [Methylobacterium komagatae]
MGLSEHDAEERLAQLRRQREALDREIADLVLYLELGRRLKAGAPRPATPDPLPMADHPPSVPEPWSEPWPEPRSEPEAVPTFTSPPPRPRRPSAPEPVAFAEDPTGARRYGRALVEAACAILAAAGQPLHAREIHDGLIARGFAIPGRDPVAALNTRLWKRSGEGGPLRRHGDAVYGLADE